MGLNQSERCVLLLLNCCWFWFWFRTGPFEVTADLEESMEFVEPDASGLADESAEEVVTDEETDLGTDWETVPSPRFCDIPSQVEQNL